MRQERAENELTTKRSKNGLSAECLGQERGRAILGDNTRLGYMSPNALPNPGSLTIP